MPLSRDSREEVELIDSRKHKSTLDPEGPPVERAAPRESQGGFSSATRYIALDPSQRRLLGFGGFGQRRWLVIGSCVLLLVILAGSIALWQSGGSPPAAGPALSSVAEEDLNLGLNALATAPSGESASSLGGDDSQQLLPGVVTPIDIASAPDSKEATTATDAGSPDAESSAPARAFCNFTGVYVPEGLLIPLTYNISLEFAPQSFLPDDTLAQHTFSAAAKVTFAVRRDTSCVVLHSVGLSYERIMVWREDGDLCVCGEGCHQSSCNAVVANVSSPLPSIPQGMVRIDLGSIVLAAGSIATLAFQYTGRFNPQQQGIYRSAPYMFTDPTGGRDSSVLLVTQLESTGARHVFPCYDEPSYKARYNLALTYPSGLKALSNMPAMGPAVAAETPGQESLVYKTTPVMSTYVVAICIGNIVPMSATAGGALNVSVWSVPELQHQLELPLQISTSALEFYTNYTGIEQPLPKFDLVAVPGKQGAMENYGLLLFDEARFLWNKDTEGAYGRWLSANVICHELAHQWFGNLVTAKDWTQITVNEGMASFMEYKCVQAALPEINVAALFYRATSPMGEALGIHEGPRRLAALVDDEPYTASLVPKVDEYGQLVLASSGAITYSKGAAIFGMLEGYWEAGRAGSFQEGLQDYLHEHMFGNASVQDVLASLGKTFTSPVVSNDASKANVSADTDLWLRWFSQPGIPLLSVSLDEREAQQISVSQSRFLLWTVAEEPGIEPWLIPFGTSSFGQSSRKWATLQTPSAVVPQDTSSNASAWNLNSGGLFRVHYPSSMLQNLAAAIQQLTPINLTEAGGPPPQQQVDAFLEAAAVIDDAFALLHAGTVQPIDAIMVAEAVSRSPAGQGDFGGYLLWGTLLDRLGMLRYLLLGDSTCIGDFDRFTATLLAEQSSHVVSKLKADALSPPQLTLLTQQQDAFLGKLAEGKILQEAAVNGDSGSAAFLCDLYKEHANADGVIPGNSSLSPDLRGAAYIAAVTQPDGCQLSYGDNAVEAVWNAMRQKWEQDNDLAESRRGLFALASTTQLEHIPDALEVILDPQGTAPKAVTSSDRLATLQKLSRSLEGSMAVWNYLRANWDTLSNRLGSWSLWSLLSELPLLPNTQILGIVQSFVKHHGEAVPRALRYKIVGRLTHNTNWAKIAGAQFCQILHDRE